MNDKERELMEFRQSDAEYFAQYMNCNDCHIFEYCETKASLTCAEVFLEHFNDTFKNAVKGRAVTMTKKDLAKCLEEAMECKTCMIRELCEYNAGVPCGSLWLTVINEIIENEKEINKNDN